MTTLRAILGRAIDYAGLFPPASLDLASSTANYAAYRNSNDAWALGRLILPASTLPAFRQQTTFSTDGWPLSLLLTSASHDELAPLSNQLHAVDTFECKLTQIGSIASIMRSLPPDANVFFEIDSSLPLEDAIVAIATAGAATKIRTGALTPQVIPPASAVARFLVLCARYRVPFKATAGLHHPIRSDHPLTYQPNSPIGTMHGFVNLTVAAAMAHLGANEEEVCRALEEKDVTAFRFDEKGVCWRGFALSIQQITALRTDFFLSFGSCSFTEPLADSRSLGWLA